METSDVRRRLRGAIDAARARAAERRARNDDAARAYSTFLTSVAVPAFHVLAQALAAEGHRFKVATPGEAVQLAAEFAPEDFLELSHDTSGEEPAIVLRTSRGRGRRNVTTEVTPFTGRAVSALTDDDVVDAVLAALGPFLER